MVKDYTDDKKKTLQESKKDALRTSHHLSRCQIVFTTTTTVNITSVKICHNFFFNFVTI